MRDETGLSGDLAVESDARARLSAIVEDLNAAADGLSPAGRLKQARAAIDGALVLTTSFGLEDQYIAHALSESGVDARIATLDTGRLFPETYDLWARTEAKYGVRIEPFYPQSEALEALVARQGINGFYDSIEARKACCFVRKVEPLSRALAGAAAWITGLRAEQSTSRSKTSFAEVDLERGLIKLNPLFDWTWDRLQTYVRALEVPYNTLHDQGYPSVGCQPCTRAVRIGENPRAGRWWWEKSDQECGLHVATPAR